MVVKIKWVMQVEEGLAYSKRSITDVIAFSIVNNIIIISRVIRIDKIMTEGFQHNE